MERLALRRDSDRKKLLIEFVLFRFAIVCRRLFFRVFKLSSLFHFIAFCARNSVEELGRPTEANRGNRIVKLSD